MTADIFIKNFKKEVKLTRTSIKKKKITRNKQSAKRKNEKK